MNRAQRRKLAKQGLDHRDLKVIYDTTKQESIRQAVELYSVAVAMVLRDKWGFGKVRLERFLGQVQYLFDSIEKDYVSLEDCKQTLLEECGIEIK